MPTTPVPIPTRQAAGNRRRRWRRFGWVLLLVLTPILVTAAFAALTLPVAAEQVYGAPAPAGDARATVTIDPGKPTAVIVLGPQGTNVADSLPPFEVLAVTGRFNVLLAATTPGPAPLAGGVDVVPDTTFEQLATLVPGGPDVVIVPQLKGDRARMKPVLDWLRKVHAGPRPPLMVSVCVGARQLAEAGILERRPATSHWLGMIGLRRDFSGVRWRDDVTYVDDGDVITSAGVLFGIDATLRVVERLTDQQTAAAAAAAIHWDRYSPGRPARIDPPHPARPTRPRSCPRRTGGTAPPLASCSPAASVRPRSPRPCVPTLNSPTWTTAPPSPWTGIQSGPRTDSSSSRTAASPHPNGTWTGYWSRATPPSR